MNQSNKTPISLFSYSEKINNLSVLYKFSHLALSQVFIGILYLLLNLSLLYLLNDIPQSKLLVYSIFSFTFILSVFTFYLIIKDSQHFYFKNEAYNNLNKSEIEISEFLNLQCHLSKEKFQKHILEQFKYDNFIFSHLNKNYINYLKN